MQLDLCVHRSILSHASPLYSNTRCRVIKRVKQSSAAAFLKESNEFQAVLLTWRKSLERETQVMTAFLSALRDLKASQAQLTLLRKKRLPLTPRTAWTIAREVDALADAMWTLSAGEEKHLSTLPKARGPAHDRQQLSEPCLEGLVSESYTSDVREFMIRAVDTARSSRAKVFRHRQHAMLAWRKRVCVIQSKMAAVHSVQRNNARRSSVVDGIGMLTLAKRM
jgi:hypothetical protein